MLLSQDSTSCDAQSVDLDNPLLPEEKLLLRGNGALHTALMVSFREVCGTCFSVMKQRGPAAGRVDCFQGVSF